jgi:hypothetical protein
VRELVAALELGVDPPPAARCWSLSYDRRRGLSRHGCMLGEYVLTEHDLVEGRPRADAVAMGSYNIDIREVERTWRYLPEYDRVPAVFNEGPVHCRPAVSHLAL